MTIDISTLTNNNHIPVSFAESFTVSPEYNLTQNDVLVTLSGKIRKEGKLFSFDGILEATLHFNCDKCLSPMEYPVYVDVCEKFSNTETEAVTDDNEIEIWPFVGKTIDLRQSTLCNLLLSIPTKVLCKESCEGLCNICGRDLNLGDCGCNRSPIDPRLADLFREV